MEEQYSFLRHSTIIDLVALAVVLFSSFCLILAGIGLLIRGKRRKWFYVLIATAFFPLLISIADAAFRMVSFEMLVPKGVEIDHEDWARFRSESYDDAYLMLRIGAVGTAVPLLIGGCGLIFKKDSEALT